MTWLCWLGCIGKARVPNPSPFPLVVGFSLPESVLGTVVGSAELCPVFLPCWFTSAVMNSGVGCVLQPELSVDAALMLPDDFDFALMRDWLGLKRSLTDCSWPVVPRPESSWPAALVAQPVLGPMLLQVCASRYFYSRVRTPTASCCARWPVAVPTVVRCVRVSDDLESDSLRFLVRRVEFRL